MSPPNPRHGRIWDGCRVALLGGSFNPAHAGHRHISLEAMKRLGLDAVWWLVSPQNPLKPVQGMAPFADRLDSARAAARHHPRIVVTGIEAELGTRFTADTLQALAAKFPRTEFVWLMGADNLAQIRHWQKWRKIFETVPVAVYDRPSYSLRALSGLAARRFATARIDQDHARTLAGTAPPSWVFFLAKRHPASATALRAARTSRHPPPASWR
jgi:nicotinate-nucleotide adenylyltransferase